MTLPAFIVLGHGVHLPAFSTHLVHLGKKQIKSPNVHSEAPGWTLLVAHGLTARNQQNMKTQQQVGNSAAVARSVSSGQSRKRAKERGSAREFKM